jgi:Cu(I)/Ag(I) efflux system membrane protein CusA/SilA
MMALQKTGKINDGSGRSVWISTHFWSTGTGADVMIPHCCSLIGGTITSTIYVLLNTCCFFEMTKLRELRTKGKIDIIDAKH